MQIKRIYLIFAFVAVAVIASLYGIAPAWFARTFLDVPNLGMGFSHILRAIMGLYLALGLFWLFAAFDERYRNVAVLTRVIFCAGLVSGRLISLVGRSPAASAAPLRCDGVCPCADRPLGLQPT